MKIKLIIFVKIVILLAILVQILVNIIVQVVIREDFILILIKLVYLIAQFKNIGMIQSIIYANNVIQHVLPAIIQQIMVASLVKPEHSF